MSAPAKPWHPPLSPREREVVSMLSEGLSDREIASKAGISVHTVKTHKEHAYGKLGVRNAAHAVAVAVREGIVE